jgi:hypothetical protein
MTCVRTCLEQADASELLARPCMSRKGDIVAHDKVPITILLRDRVLAIDKACLAGQLCVLQQSIPFSLAVTFSLYTSQPIHSPCYVLIVGRRGSAQKPTHSLFDPIGNVTIVSFSPGFTLSTPSLGYSCNCMRKRSSPSKQRLRSFSPISFSR